MTASKTLKSLLQEARCGSPQDSTIITELATQISHLEWKLRQEREKVRRLEQRLADIEALDGGALNDKHHGTNKQS